MARKLRVEIDGDSTSGRRAIDSFAAEADKAARELAKMEAKADAASVKARKLGEAEEQTANKTRELIRTQQALERQIADTGDETGDLARKLDRVKVAIKSNAAATDDYRRSASRAAAEAREQARAYDRLAEKARKAATAQGAAAAAAAVKPPPARDPLAVIERQFAARDRVDRIRKRIAVEEERDRRSRRSRLASILDIGEAGAEGGLKGIGAGVGAIGSVSQAAGPYGTLAGITAGAVAAPLAGSFLGGAAGGAIGLGGAAAGAGLGLAGAWMGDPAKYGAMWDKAIDGIQGRWMKSSAAFGDELEDSLKVVDRTLRDLPVEKILDLSQGFVMPLVGGAGSGITAAADGFADLLESAQPIVDTVGPELANLGHDIGDSMRAIGMGSEGGAAALGDLINVMGYAVKATGVLIMGFENTYLAIRNFEKANSEFVSKTKVIGPIVDTVKGKLFDLGSTAIVTGKALGGVDDNADPVAKSLASVATEAARAAASAGGFNDTLTQTRSLMLGLADANISLAEGWFTLKEELADGAKTLDLSTKAGVENQKALVAQIKLAEAARDAEIQRGDGTADAIATANAAYDANIAKIKQMAHEAGLTDDQVNTLIATYAEVPDEVQTKIAVLGAQTAITQAATAAAVLGSIDRVFTATIRVAGLAQALADAARASAALPGYAGGGTFGSTGFKLVGEEGPEVIWGKQSQYVSTAAQTKQLAQQMSRAPSGGSGGGYGALTLRVASGGGDAFASLIATLVSRGQIQLFADGQPVTVRP